MALPTTITGIDLGCRVLGPFKSSGGNYYLFGRDGTTATTLQAFKSSAPDTSWASITTKTGFTTSVISISGNQNGDVIHMIVEDGVGTSANFKYQTFDMSSDTFVTAETIVSAINITDSGGGSYGLCELIFDPVNAQPTALYPGPRVSTHAKVNTKHRTGVATWSAAVVVDAAVITSDAYPFGIAIGDSGLIHFFTNPDGSSCVERAITSAFALQTAVSISGVSGTFSGKPTSLVNGGTTKVCCGAIGDLTANTRGLYFDSASVPTVNVSSDIGTGADTHIGPKTYADVTDFWVLYTRTTTGGVYVAKSTTSGSTWGAETLAMSATATASGPNGDEFLSYSATVYQRGSNVVIPYTVNDAGTLKYNEFVIRTVSSDVLMAQSVM